MQPPHAAGSAATVRQGGHDAPTNRSRATRCTVTGARLGSPQSDMDSPHPRTARGSPRRPPGRRWAAAGSASCSRCWSSSATARCPATGSSRSCGTATRPATAAKVVQNLVSQLRREPARRRRAAHPRARVRARARRRRRSTRPGSSGCSTTAAGRSPPASRSARRRRCARRSPSGADRRWASSPTTPWARTESGRLEEQRLVALERRIDADLALGRHADVVGELEAAVAREPLREGLRAQLMLALYRSGRQAEALAAYAGRAPHARERARHRTGPGAHDACTRRSCARTRRSTLRPRRRSSRHPAPPPPGRRAAARRRRAARGRRAPRSCSLGARWARPTGLPSPATGQLVALNAATGTVERRIRGRPHAGKVDGPRGRRLGGRQRGADAAADRARRPGPSTCSQPARRRSTSPPLRQRSGSRTAAAARPGRRSDRSRPRSSALDPATGRAGGDGDAAVRRGRVGVAGRRRPPRRLARRRVGGHVGASRSCGSTPRPPRSRRPRPGCARTRSPPAARACGRSGSAAGCSSSTSAPPASAAASSCLTRDAGAFAVGDDAVWVAGNKEPKLWRIGRDRRRGDRRGRSSRAAASAVAVAGDRVWVANAIAGDAHRGRRDGHARRSARSGSAALRAG